MPLLLLLRMWARLSFINFPNPGHYKLTLHTHCVYAICTLAGRMRNVFYAGIRLKVKVNLQDSRSLWAADSVWLWGGGLRVCVWVCVCVCGCERAGKFNKLMKLTRIKCAYFTVEESWQALSKRQTDSERERNWQPVASQRDILPPSLNSPLPLSRPSPCFLWYGSPLGDEFFRSLSTNCSNCFDLSHPSARHTIMHAIN